MHASKSNYNYARICNELINSFLDKNLLLDEEVIEQLTLFIQDNLDTFILFPENPVIIEASYDIVTLCIKEINSSLEEKIVNTVFKYREGEGKHSLALLSLLWFFGSHDDVLLKSAEIHAPKYSKVRRKNLTLVERKNTKNSTDNMRETYTSQVSHPSTVDFSSLSPIEKVKYKEEEKKRLEEERIKREKKRKERCEGVFE